MIKENPMSRNSDVSNVSRRQFLAAAGTVAAASSFAVGKDSDSAQTTPPLPPADYVVTIDVTTKPISYSARDGQGNVVNMSNNGLMVNPNDSVTWKVHSRRKKYSLTIGFFNTTTTPLMDASNNPLYSVSGTEADEGTKKIGGMIEPNATGTYKYSVRGKDDAGTPFPDDPTIIVGKLSPRAKLIEAKGELKQVEDKIKSIEEELGVIIDELK
jgi:hypothetical protein